MPKPSWTRAEALRGSLRDWIVAYSRKRGAQPYVGEFLDDEGASNKQFGISGSCMVSSIEDAERLQPPRFHLIWAALQHALSKPPAQRTDDERHLLKDVPRIPNKSILLALGPKSEIDPAEVVKEIFAKRASNGLIKPVLDDPQAEGDPVVTAMVILVLRFGSRDGEFMTEIHSVLPELRRLVDQGHLDLLEKLLLSTAVCTYDFAASIDGHRRLLSELYASDLDWHRAFSSNSPFLDHRFGDPAAPARARNRYLRIPAAFVIMGAIYLTIGDERRFFGFPPVRALLRDVKLPFHVQVGRDKNKASAYFAWFVYAALHLDRFMRTPRQHRVRVELSRVAYYWKDLTWAGLIVVLVCVIGSGCVVWFSIELATKGAEGHLDKWIGSVGTTLGAVLGLFRTRKR